MRTKEQRGEVIIAVGLLLLVLVVFKVLLQPGFYESHDGLFHLVRVEAMADELARGQFPVRMASDLAFGRGYAIFNFFYPLFYYLAAGVGLLGLTAEDSVKVVILAATWLSLWAGYRWLRCFFDKKAALTGAILLLLVPYRFLLTLVIGSYGGIMAWLLVMVSLWAISEAVVKRNSKFLPIVSIGLGGLIVAHNVTALMFAPVIALYSLVLIWLYKYNLVKLLLAGVLGLGLSAWFWIPTLTEMEWVRLSEGNAANYQDHWSSLRQVLYSPWGYGYSGPGVDDGMSFMLGLTQWLVVMLAAVILLSKILKKQKIGGWKKIDLLAVFILIVFVVSVWMMLQGSAWFWKMIPVLAQLQFPWRWLIVSAVAVSFLAAWLVKRFGWLMMVMLVVLAVIANRNLMRTLTGGMEPMEKWQQEARLQPGSTDIAWEVLPRGARPEGWQVDWQIRGGGILRLEILEAQGGERGRWRVEMEKEGKVEISKYHLPLWQVEVNGEVVESKPGEDGGYIEIKLPSGVSEVVLSIRQTEVERGANLISVFGLVGLVLWWRGKRNRVSAEVEPIDGRRKIGRGRSGKKDVKLEV